MLAYAHTEQLLKMIWKSQSSQHFIQLQEAASQRNMYFFANQQRKKGGWGSSLHLYADQVKVGTFEMSNKADFHHSKLI